MGFDEVIDRTASASSRWRGRGDTLALTIGDADFRTPPAIRAAIDARLDEGVLGYDSVSDALVQVILDRLASRFNWQVDATELVFMPGVVQGLNLACRAMVPAGHKVLCETPVYYPFLDAPANSGCELAGFPAVLTGGRWQFDFDALAVLAAQDDAHLLLLCHPQNPLGRSLTRAELRRIADICRQHDVLICSDEIHCDLLFDDHRHVPMASLGREVASNTITLMSPSKAFGMSGLGGAFAVIPDPDVRAAFKRTGAGVISNINVVSLAAMHAAYSACDDYLAREVAYLQGNRDFLVQALSALPGIGVTVPESTYFLWIDFRQTGLNDPYNALLEAGVELSRGERFGGDGYLRLNFASPRSRLELAVRRISGVLKR